MLTLRKYQRQSIDALYSYWKKGGENGLIVLPVGAGKSLVMAALCQELIANYPTLRIGIVTHVKELLTQSYQELLRLWPAAPVGLYSAGLAKRDTHTQILIAGIQSVWNKTSYVGSFDVLMIDEAHLISRNTATMYGKFIETLRRHTPDMRLVGLTGSPWRMDSGRLDRGKGRLFDKVVFEASIGELIDQGYLCRLISKATQTMLDVSKVSKRGGEYIAGELEIAVDVDWVTKSAAKEIVQFGIDRKAWLAFCSGVKHAKHMRDAIKEHNISCETVTGETPKAERDSYIRQFKAGKIRCLTSVGVLGTGFNHPGCDLIALLRPTQSSSLFLQQCGRGLRTSPGKKDCLVLDFGNLVKTHGPVDALNVKTSGIPKENGEPLAKTCPVCQTIVALVATQCPTCGHLFPRDLMPKHEATADSSTSILSQGKAQWMDVDEVKYYQHNKPGSPPSLRVEYQVGFTTHKEWVCLSHKGFARSKAEVWWLKTGAKPIPNTVDEALRRVKELKKVEQICVRPSGKYFEVVGVRFEKIQEAAE